MYYVYFKLHFYFKLKSLNRNFLFYCCLFLTKPNPWIYIYIFIIYMYIFIYCASICTLCVFMSKYMSMHIFIYLCIYGIILFNVPIIIIHLNHFNIENIIFVFSCARSSSLTHEHTRQIIWFDKLCDLSADICAERSLIWSLKDFWSVIIQRWSFFRERWWTPSIWNALRYTTLWRQISYYHTTKYTKNQKI